MPNLSEKYKMILMIIAPIAIVGLSLGIYYGIKKEKFKSCTCSKDNQYKQEVQQVQVQEQDRSSQVPAHETYTYSHNQPKTDIAEIKLTPVNDFGVGEVQPKERYSTAYYKEAQNNPDTHSRFSGV